MAHNKYYSSIKERIKYDTAANERTTIKAKPLSPVQRIDFSDFYIPEFPSRLKKGLFRGLDKRYYLILAGSIVFNILMVIFLYHNTSSEMSDENIARLQSHYMNLILDQTEQPGQVETEQQKKFSRLIPETEEIPEESGLSDDARSRRRSRREQADSRETKVPDAQRLSEERESAQLAREGQKGALSAQVGQMGILEYLKSRIITSKVDEEFLNYTDQSTQNFVRMMDGLDSEDLALFKLNRNPGSDPYGLSFGAGTEFDSLYYLAKLKSKRLQPKTKAVDLFDRENPMEEFEDAPVDKNEDFEKGEPSVDALAKLRARIVERTPAELSKTIRSHNRAVQDCYKTQLRREVGLKGKVVVRIGIDPQGQVVNADMISSTLNNEKVEQCILSRIRRWKDFGICPSQQGIFTFSQSYSFGE